MASLDPVIDETVPGSPFRCLPDSTSKEAYVMQHGISVVCGENNPHVKQYQDPGGVFWPSNLLSQERDRPCVFTHKARLNIWDGRPESSFQGESETLALDLMEMVQSYPNIEQIVIMAYSMGSLVTLGAVRQLYLYIATGRSNGPDACKVLSCLKALILIGPPLTGSPLAFYFARFPGTNWVLEALTQDSEILKGLLDDVTLLLERPIVLVEAQGRSEQTLNTGISLLVLAETDRTPLPYLSGKVTVVPSKNSQGLGSQIQHVPKADHISVNQVTRTSFQWRKISTFLQQVLDRGEISKVTAIKLSNSNATMVEVTQNEKAVEDILKERSEHVQKWKMGSAVILSNIPPLEVAMLLQESRHQAKVYTASELPTGDEESAWLTTDRDGSSLCIVTNKGLEIELLDSFSENALPLQNKAYSDDLVAHALPSDLQEGVVLLRKAGEVRAVLDVGNYFCSVPEEVQEIEDYFLDEGVSRFAYNAARAAEDTRNNLKEDSVFGQRSLSFAFEHMRADFGGKYEAALICAEKAMRKLVKMNQSEKEVAEKATGGQESEPVELVLNITGQPAQSSSAPQDRQTESGLPYGITPRLLTVQGLQTVLINMGHGDEVANLRASRATRSKYETVLESLLEVGGIWKEGGKPL